LSPFNSLSAQEINWVEIANTTDEKQFIDTNSIKYNNKGLLSVVTKYSEINPDDHNIIKTNSYLMAIDCEKRLFSNLPVNGELKQIKKWNNPINDKLIKTTILNSCSY
tara:strand:+ start:7726 stop:8049 length:324 start_codon:yes stop_codon:yes gene_type:complete